MSNTINRDPVTTDRIASGTTYASDPVIAERVEVIGVVDPATDNYAGAQKNDFLHFRDVRSIVTGALAIVATGAFALGLILFLGGAATVLGGVSLFVGIAAGLIGVLVGRTRSHSRWAYQLAGYAAIACATLAVLSIAFTTLAGTTVTS